MNVLCILTSIKLESGVLSLGATGSAVSAFSGLGATDSAVSAFSGAT